MRSENFNVLLDDTLRALHKISETKGREYSGEHDRLSQFKDAGARLGIDPRAVLLIYLDKHYASITRYCKEAHANQVRVHQLSEPIESRIDDALMYLMLLKGLIFDLTHDEPLKSQGGFAKQTAYEPTTR